MTPRKGGLGRGLDAMISETAMKSRPTAKNTEQRKQENSRRKKRRKRFNSKNDRNRTK